MEYNSIPFGKQQVPIEVFVADAGFDDGQRIGLPIVEFCRRLKQQKHLVRTGPPQNRRLVKTIDRIMRSSIS
jgi:hypothetical protein